jgi:hypothetical protein
LTSVSPVTSVSADTVKIEGVTRVEDLINNMPQAFADFGGNLSNGATGTASVNLRNLGSQRTLVLVNSRRLMPAIRRRTRRLRRPEPDSRGADRARRSADRRRVRRVRRRRRRGRRQLHHERQVRRRARRCAVQPVPAQQHDDTIGNIVRDAGFALPTATYAMATPRT